MHFCIILMLCINNTFFSYVLCDLLDILRPKITDFVISFFKYILQVGFYLLTILHTAFTVSMHQKRNCPRKVLVFDTFSRKI
jgi:hypothetical protein